MSAVTYRQVELEQGSPEWHAWRAERYTASLAPAVMDASPFVPRNKNELYLIRTGQKEVFVTQAMRDGSASEERIKQLVAEKTGQFGAPACFEAEVIGLPLGASLDMWTGTEAHEFKRQNKGSEGKLWTSEDPGHYLWQLVHTLLSCPADAITLWAYAHDLDEVKAIHRLERDSDEFRKLSAELLAEWKSFDYCLSDMTPPQAESVDLSEEPGWVSLADQYRQAQAEAKAADERAEALKAELLALAQGTGAKKVIGAGFQVYSAERAGNVNWKAKAIVEALKAANVDPDAFRGKSTKYWVLKEASA